MQNDLIEPSLTSREGYICCIEFGIRNLDLKWCWYALCLTSGLDPLLNMGKWALSRLLQDYCWDKPSVQSILRVEITESKVECQSSLCLHIPAASAEDEWCTFFFYCKCFLSFFYFLKNHSDRKCQVANTTPDNFLHALYTELGGWWRGIEVPGMVWR